MLEQQQRQSTETAEARWIRWKKRLLDKEIVHASEQKVADAVAYWRLRQKQREEDAMDATVGKAKVKEDWTMWLEWQWECKQLPHGEQLGYGLWIIDTMMSRGFSSHWAGMAARMEI
jgi:hypothetical protein